MLKQIIFMFSKCRVLRHPARLKTSRSTFQNASRVFQSITLRLAAERKNAPCVKRLPTPAAGNTLWRAAAYNQTNIEPLRENPDTASPHAQLVYLHVVISWKVWLYRWHLFLFFKYYIFCHREKNWISLEKKTLTFNYTRVKRIFNSLFLAVRTRCPTSASSRLNCCVLRSDWGENNHMEITD